jgi:hypothetical protein
MSGGLSQNYGQSGFHCKLGKGCFVKSASPFGPCFRGKAYLYDHIVDLNVSHRCAIRTICEALRRICYGQGKKHGGAYVKVRVKS